MTNRTGWVWIPAVTAVLLSGGPGRASVPRPVLERLVCVDIRCELMRQAPGAAAGQTAALRVRAARLSAAIDALPEESLSDEAAAWIRSSLAQCAGEPSYGLRLAGPAGDHHAEWLALQWKTRLASCTTGRLNTMLAQRKRFVAMEGDFEDALASYLRGKLRSLPTIRVSPAAGLMGADTGDTLSVLAAAVSEERAPPPAAADVPLGGDAILDSMLTAALVADVDHVVQRAKVGGTFVYDNVLSDVYTPSWLANPDPKPLGDLGPATERLWSGVGFNDGRVLVLDPAMLDAFIVSLQNTRLGLHDTITPLRERLALTAPFRPLNAPSPVVFDNVGSEWAVLEDRGH